MRPKRWIALSCLLSVAAQVASAADSSGRNSHFWMTLRPRAGMASATNTDLVLQNGYRSVNLDSPDLSCKRVVVGSKWVYQVTWTGNSFLGGPEAEALQFDVVVEAFSGAKYAYSASASASSVASLGNPTAPADTNNHWGVGGEDGVAAGESLRMTLRDVKVAGASPAAQGLVAECTFSEFETRVDGGGTGHKLIHGVGQNRPSASVSAAPGIYIINGESYSVTGAGSSGKGTGWALGQVECSIVVRNPALSIEDPEHPFADVKYGYAAGPTPYTPTTPEKLKAFPSFSWDRIPRGMLIRKARAYTDGEIKAIADNYDLVVLEKANNAGQKNCMLGMKHTADRLKAANPGIKTLFYWNSRIYFGHYGIDDSIEDHMDEYIDKDFIIRGRLKTYNRENPNFLKWWVGCCEKMISHPSIDGTFIDKTGVPISMLDPLYKATPVNKLVMNNNAAARERIGYVDGTYREDYMGGGDLDKLAMSLAIAQETGANQKMQIFRNPVKRVSSKRQLEDKINLRLALYLVSVEKYAYFYCQATVDATKPQWQWETSYLDQLRRPLGKPLGPAARDNRVYTRSFEHCDVYLDLRRNPGDGVRILWKNDVGEPALPGGGVSRRDNTYRIQGSGALSGTSDRFFYLSDAHYGDGEVEACVDTLESAHADAKAGIMFRESLAADAKMVAVLRDQSGRMHMVCRTTQGAALVSAGVVGTGTGPYAKLVRSGDDFVGACSPDGKTWTRIANVTIPMAEKTEMGLAVSSQDNSALATATVRAFSRFEGSGKPAVTERASVFHKLKLIHMWGIR